jgi:hypothetical protein
MTVKDIYDDVLVEINKENAQSFTIEEFNYILNKAINTWVNERYGFYAADQQLTDDLRVLIKEAVINVGALVSSTYNVVSSSVAADTSAVDVQVTSAQDLTVGKKYKIGEGPSEYALVNIVVNTTYDITATFDTVVTANAGDQIFIETAPVELQTDYMNDQFVEVTLPTSDYFHPLSCKVVWKSVRRSGGNVNITFPAKRLTFDMYDFIQNNTYMRPHPNRPYYQVLDHVKNSGYWQAGSTSEEYQNQPTFKIFLGKQPPNLDLKQILIYTLKLPEKLTLYDDDIFTFDVDNSQVVEFPDYLKNEFVRRITMYMLEKSSNPRIQTQPQINQDIPPVPLNIQMGGNKQGTPETAQAQAQQQQQRQQ